MYYIISRQQRIIPPKGIFNEIVVYHYVMGQGRAYFEAYLKVNEFWIR